ncbi:putative CBL-interacting protein kinase 6 [Iris pallida]|uniref:CBL-interacting protein kinase 6 n=1 Tax=Iris pallida TaxID=29817 RepID=A0AAX6EJ30_IRIPA|nr:putative CBL-interacting protein kinase 6 [Iris pallida]
MQQTQPHAQNHGGAEQQRARIRISYCTNNIVDHSRRGGRRRGVRRGRPHDVLERGPQLVAAEGPVLERVAPVPPHVHHEHRRRHREYLRGHRQPPLPSLPALQPHARGGALRHPQPAPPAAAPPGQPLQPRYHPARRLRRREPHPSPRAAALLEERRQVEAPRERYEVERVEPLGLLGGVLLRRRRRRRRRRVGGGFLEPGGVEDLGDGDPGGRVGVEEPGDEAAGVGGEPRGAPEVPPVGLPVHGQDVVVLEREEAGEEHVEDDAAGPEVGLPAVVALPRDDLRRDVRRGPARGAQEVGAGEGAEAEVGDLEVAAVVEEEVLRLEVAVVDAAGVAEGDGGEELAEVAAGGVLAEAAVAGDAGEELAAADELHGEVDLGAGGHDLVELHDVGVGDHLHGGDLPLDLLRHADAEHLLLGDHLLKLLFNK